jgi:hypothetical protein
VVRPHTIDAMMRLAGRQQTAVTVHHAGTPEATVVVQIGRAVIYLHSIPAADRFATIWQEAQPDAAQLPRNRNLERGRRTGPLAIAEPSIVVHAAGTPAGTVRLARGPRLEPTLLGIQVGNLALRLFDQGAFTAPAEAFLQAQRAAREHLTRADPTRGERLRGEPALPRRTTAAVRDKPGLPRRAAAADSNGADPDRAHPGRADPDRAHPAALARAALTPPPSAARTPAPADAPTAPSAAARLGLRRPPGPAARPTSAAARLGLRSPLPAPSPAARRTAR